MAEPLKLSVKGGMVLAHRAVGDGCELSFSVENLRQAPTGVHGRLSINLDTWKLAWNTFNLERDDDRTRLANAAYKMAAGKLKDIYSADFLKLDLADFCEHCWDALVAQDEPLEEKGYLGTGPEFVLSPYVIKGGGSIMFGPPGKGKSFVGLAMAIAVDSGPAIDRPQLWTVKQHPTLFINLERPPDTVRQRLGRVNKALGLRPDRRLLMHHARGRRLSQVMPALTRAVEKHRLGFVVVDSLSRAGYGSLKDDEAINSTIDALNSLGTAWLALAHTPISDETHIFGGQQWAAGEDVGIQFSSEEQRDGTLGIGLQVTKGNDIRKPPMQVLKLTFEETGLAGISRGDIGDFAELASKRTRKTADRVRELLLRHGKLTGTQLHSMLSVAQSTISEILNHDPQFVALTKTTGRDVYYVVRE